MTVKLLMECNLEFLSLIRGCTGSSESIHVKMPHCWKSHVTAHLFLVNTCSQLVLTVRMKPARICLHIYYHHLPIISSKALINGFYRNFALNCITFVLTFFSLIHFALSLIRETSRLVAEISLIKLCEH